MSLSSTVAELAAVYEEKHGQKLTEQALQAAEHILKVGKMLAELGKKDAQEGKKPRPAEVFPALVRKVFHNILDEATTKEIADLWRLDYMDGYQEHDAV